MSESFSSIFSSITLNFSTVHARPWRVHRVFSIAHSFTVGAALLAILLTLFTPCVFAQQPETSPTSAVPIFSASTLSQTPPQLAQAQGQTETAALDWILAHSGPLTGDTQAGDFRIAFTVTPAEGWWDKADGGKLKWHDAPADNIHLRIFVMSLADGRLVPALNLRAVLIDANGNRQAAPVDFGWYPLLNAYGANVPLAADSSYILRVTVAPPASASPGGHCPPATIAEFPPIPIALDAVSQLPLATASASAIEAELLKPLNTALSKAITALWQQSISGEEKAAGDYFVSYALDRTGLTLPLGNAKVRLNNLLDFSGKADVRLMLLVRDSRTGRLIPGLKPVATLVASDGKLYGPGAMPLSSDSWLTDYERTVRIARKDIYTLRVHFDAPGFRRWGRSEERFAQPVDVEFDNISLKPAKGATP